MGFRFHDGNRAPRPPFVLNTASPQARGLRYWGADPQSDALYDLSGRGNTGAYDGLQEITTTTFGSIAVDTPDPSSTDSRGTVIDDINGLGSVISVSIWVNLRANVDEHFISRGTDWIFSVRSAGGRVRFYNGSTEATTPAGSLSNNVWQHFAAVYDGAEIQLYKNGLPSGATVSSTATLAETAGKTRIGGYANGGGFGLQGKYFDPRIYEVALSDAEVYAIWNPATRWDLFAPRSRVIGMPVAAAPSTGGLYMTQRNLNGLGAGGPFFTNPLG